MRPAAHTSSPARTPFFSIVPVGRRRDRRAFTMVELIIVIVILGILAAIAVVGYGRVVARSHDEVALAELRALNRAASALVTFDAPVSTYDLDVFDEATDELEAYAGGVLAAPSQASPGTNGDYTVAQESLVMIPDVVPSGGDGFSDAVSGAHGWVSVAVNADGTKAGLAMKSRAGNCARVWAAEGREKVAEIDRSEDPCAATVDPSDTPEVPGGVVVPPLGPWPDVALVAGDSQIEVSWQHSTSIDTATGYMVACAPVGDDLGDGPLVLPPTGGNSYTALMPQPNGSWDPSTADGTVVTYLVSGLANFVEHDCQVSALAADYSPSVKTPLPERATPTTDVEALADPPTPGPWLPCPAGSAAGCATPPVTTIHEPAPSATAFDPSGSAEAAGLSALASFPSAHTDAPHYIYATAASSGSLVQVGDFNGAQASSAHVVKTGLGKPVSVIAGMTPRALFADSSVAYDALWVIDQGSGPGSGRLLRLSPNGYGVSVFATGLDNPTDLTGFACFDGAGQRVGGVCLYVTTASGVVVVNTATTSGNVTAIAGSPAGGTAIDAISVGGQPRLAVSNGGNVTVIAVDGSTVSAIGGQSAAAGLGLVGDADGWVADSGANTLRSVNYTAASSALVAGSGAAAHADGNGTSAAFNRPIDVLNHGNAPVLYVLDAGDNCLRRYNRTTTAVSTLWCSDNGLMVERLSSGTAFASGLGAAATPNLADPPHNRRVSYAASGGGYLYTTNNFSIYRFNATTLEGGIWAGQDYVKTGNTPPATSSDGVGTAAVFRSINDMVYDSDGYLWVSDFRCLRRINVATAQVQTIAGHAGGSCPTTALANVDVVNGAAGTATFRSLTSLVLASNGMLYATDTGCIRGIDRSSLTVTTLAGVSTCQSATAVDSTVASSVRFSLIASTGLADVGGNLYVMDRSCMRRVSYAGATLKVAGLTCADASSSTALDGVGASARFRSSSNRVVGDGTNVWLMHTGDGLLRKFVPSSAEVTTVIGAAAVPLPPKRGEYDNSNPTSYTVSSLTGISLSAAGHPTLYSQNSNVLIDYDPATASVTTRGYGAIGGNYGIGGSTALGVSDAGDVYTASGASITRFLPGAGPNGLGYSKIVTSQAAGVSAHSDGHAFESGALGSTAAVAVSDDGSALYTADSSGHCVRKVTNPTGFNAVLSTVAGTCGVSGTADGVGSAARFNAPKGIDVDGSYLWVADTGNNCVRRIHLGSGTVTTPAGSCGAAASSSPSGFTASAPGAATRFSSPSDVAAANGSVWVADTNNRCIRKLDQVSEVVSVAVGNCGGAGSQSPVSGSAATSIYNPLTVAASADGSQVFFDTYYKVYRLNVAAAQITRVAGSTGAAGVQPLLSSAADIKFGVIRRIDVTPDGKLWVAAGSVLYRLS